MLKKCAQLIIVSLLFVSLIVNVSLAANTYIWAEKGAWFYYNKKPMEHTYVCYWVNSSTRSCYSQPPQGSTSGGSALSKADGWGNGSTVKCVGTNSKCRMEWIWDGLCHQGSNRMLYGIGKTVYKAGGYNISTAAFGLYGRFWSNWNDCKKKCF